MNLLGFCFIRAYYRHFRPLGGMNTRPKLSLLLGLVMSSGWDSNNFSIAW